MSNPWDHPAVAGKHVVSRTRIYPDSVAMSVATCQCGWRHSVKVADCAELDAAVDKHWQSVIAAGVVTKLSRR